MNSFEPEPRCGSTRRCKPKTESLQELAATCSGDFLSRVSAMYMWRSNAKATLLSPMATRLLGMSDGITGSGPARNGSSIALSSNDAMKSSVRSD